MYCIRNLAFCISSALTIWWLLDYVPLNFAPGSQILEKLQTFLLNPSTLFPFEAHCEYSWCATTAQTHIYVDTMCNLWINVALAHGFQIILWSTVITLGFTILYGVPMLYFSLHNGNQVAFFDVALGETAKLMKKNYGNNETFVLLMLSRNVDPALFNVFIKQYHLFKIVNRGKKTQF